MNPKVVKTGLFCIKLPILIPFKPVLVSTCVFLAGKRSTLLRKISPILIPKVIKMGPFAPKWPGGGFNKGSLKLYLSITLMLTLNFS